MYLSRILLDMRAPQARRWLADCHKLHRAIMSGFSEAHGDHARAELGILYRLEPITNPPLVVVLVQSLVEPHWKFQTSAVVRVDGPKSLSDVINSISPGERYRFRLRVNPTRRVHRRATTGPDPAKGRLRREKPEAMGKRVELTREADQIEWLRRQAERAGFHIVSVRRLPDWPESKADVPALTASHTWKIRGFKRGTQLSLFSVLFEGVLEITDAEAFRCTLQKGIGPGKAFGCGLLSIAPP